MKIQSSLPSNKLFTSSKNEFIGCLFRTRLVWVILHFHKNLLKGLEGQDKKCYGNGPTAGNGCNIKYITRNLISNFVLVGSLKKQKVCIIFPFSIFFFAFFQMSKNAIRICLHHAAFLNDMEAFLKVWLWHRYFFLCVVTNY